MKFPIPLKGYLILNFGTVAVLPVIIVACLAWFFMVPAIQKRTEIQHQAMAHSIAGHISAYLDGGTRQLTALAAYLQNQAFNSGQTLVDLLDSQCGDGGFFEVLFVIDKVNDLVKAVGLAQPRRPKRADYTGLDFSGRGFVPNSGSPKTAVWSNTFLSTVSSRMAVALTVPLDGGSIVGEIPLGNLAEFIGHLPVESEFLTLVVDGHGVIVADSQRQRSGQVFDANFSVGEDGSAQPVSRAFHLNGVKMLGTVVEMDAVGWKVLFAQPAKLAFQPLRDILLLMGLGLTIALGLALSIAWFIAGNLTKLFASYTDRAKSIANGCYDLNWPVARTKEFLQLSQNLQRMAEKINRREKALVDSETRLKGLVANVPGVVYQFKADPDALESSSLTGVVRERSIELFGLDAEPEEFFSNFVLCIPEDDQPRFVESVKAALEAAAPWYYEGRFTKPSGEKIWFEGRSEPRWVDGELVYYGVLTEVTERKRIEASLRLTQFIFDKAPIGIWRMGLAGEVLDVNEQGCASLGYSREELCRMTVFDFAPGFETVDWESGTSRLREDGTRTIEALHQRKNGEIFPIQVISKLLRFGGEEHHLAFVQDITERKQAEDALRKNERLLNNILDSMNEGLLVLDKDFKCTIFNSALGRMVDSTREESFGKIPWEAFPALKDTPVEKNIKKTMAGESAVNFEVQLPMPRGESAWFRDSYSPLKDADGRVIGVVGVISDITKLKQNEDELRRLRNYLSNIIDSMPSIIVAVDRDGKVTQWNHRAALTTGLSLEKTRSQPLSRVFPRLAEEMEQIQTSIRERRVINSPKIPRKSEQKIRYEDITIFPLVTNGVEGAVIRVDDVTQQVQLEEMMIQSEKMLSVGGLAAGMAHEINNPLAGILQSAWILENRLLGDLPANHSAAEDAGTTLATIQHYVALRKLPGMIENVREMGKRAAAIVKNMLGFARKSDRVVSNEDLGALLDRTLELVRTDYDMKTHYDFKHIKIVREYDPAPLSVACEASKIQQVFMNILKNGAEAMAGVKDAPGPQSFVLRVRDAGIWVQVEIEDSGPGMDAKTRRRVFEPFFTTKPVGQGTGLGLSVSYFIITEDHGGEMDVHAADGGGTCFVIRLPKAGKE